jgi:hypothetical protein
MRVRALVAVGLGFSFVAALASADDSYRHGRVRFVEPGVTLQRATEVSAEEALANLPFLPGDRIWTDSAGRAEFQFPDGTLVRVDRRSKLDYAGHEEGEEERVVLRLWSGSAIVRVRARGSTRFEIETPAGLVQALDRGIVRVDVEAGETRVSVYAGEAALNDGRRQVRLAAGERTYARWGAEAEEPRRFDPGEDDDFARWDGLRESQDRWAARSSEHLPDQLDAYAGEFEANGNWQYESAAGYVWVPRVVAGWQPYSNGYWAWTPYGWTWVPYERWGWAPFHYGRWDFSLSWGWYWIPGHVWGPGWVSWAVGGGYVGWCPLGYYDRPVVPWHHRGYGGRRGRHGGHERWSIVRQGDLGRRHLHGRLVGVDQVDPTGLRVADSVMQRPTRDGSSLREDRAVPRTISRRMTPGDFVRELGPDNKTTIPAPWTRGYGPPPAGVDGARYGTPRRTDRSDGEKPSRTWVTNPGTGGAAAPRGRTTTESGRGTEASAPRRRAQTPAPRAQTPAPRAQTPAPFWAQPRAGDWTTRYRARRESGDTVDRPRGGTEPSGGSEGRGSGGGWSGGPVPRRSGGESSGSYRAPSGGGGSSGPVPRRSGGEGSGSYRAPSGGGSSGGSAPRGSGGGHGSGGSSGGYAPRSSGGGRSSGGAQPRSSGGSGGSGGGHSGSRPRSNRQ